MSALLPITDINGRRINVRFVPTTEVGGLMLFPILRPKNRPPIGRTALVQPLSYPARQSVPPDLRRAIDKPAGRESAGFSYDGEMLSEIDADGDVTAHHLAILRCICEQLRPGRVLRHSLLRLAMCFPIGITHHNKPIADPWAGVKAGHP